MSLNEKLDWEGIRRDVADVQRGAAEDESERARARARFATTAAKRPRFARTKAGRALSVLALAASVAAASTAWMRAHRSDTITFAVGAEGAPGDPPAALRELVDEAAVQIDRALDQLRRTTRDELLAFRGVGRAQLPSNVLGLLFHAAEHSTRHAGQLITTAKILAVR